MKAAQERWEDQELTTLSNALLFSGLAAIMRELRRRGVIRSEKNVIADYAEALVAQHFGVSVEPHGANPGYDLRIPEGRVQVKCRRATRSSDPGHFGDCATLDNDPFDLFVGVVFDEDFIVTDARMIALERVRELSKPVHGKRRLTLRALRGDPTARALNLRALQGEVES